MKINSKCRNFVSRMKRISLITFGLSLLLFSCLKENLDKNQLKRVMVLQIDKKTYKFEGGKEFSYFENDTSTVNLPLSHTYSSSSPGIEGRLTVKYMSDTIFDGTTVYGGGSGHRNYPVSIDDKVHFLVLDNNIAMPEESRFDTVFYDLVGEPIYLDSIWGAIRKLSLVNTYLNGNVKAKIGLVLYRPSEGIPSNSNADWKWYVILKS